MPAPSPAAPRWRATTDLTVERPGESPIRFAAGKECIGAPENWPPQWVIDQGLVSPIEADEKGGK